VVSWELEGLLSARVDSLAVGQKVRVRSELANDRAVLQYLLLDASGFLSQAEVDHFVDHVGETARVLGKVVVRALSLLASRLVARLRHESLALAPVKHSGSVASSASEVALVAVNDLLGR